MEGDFPFAYILAHEVGHHVQYQLGILQKIHKLKNEVSSKTYNQYMVKAGFKQIILGTFCSLYEK